MNELPDNKREFKSMMLAALTAMVCVWNTYFGAGLVGQKMATWDAVAEIQNAHSVQNVELLRTLEAPCASDRPLYEVRLTRKGRPAQTARFGPNRHGTLSRFVQAEGSSCGVYLPL